ncbi:hypothetical protein HK100_001347 [Physocladia obscura]|uniref:Uncharacterized protein n=1 Tax=Physocladia obscura TaxID=109957 RepID=A0AAD5SXY8_9FUNG|nr:hypothetical protein HK100_001347 [Physocladia obscura]
MTDKTLTVNGVDGGVIGHTSFCVNTEKKAHMINGYIEIMAQADMAKEAAPAADVETSSVCETTAREQEREKESDVEMVIEGEGEGEREVEYEAAKVEAAIIAARHTQAQLDDTLAELEAARKTLVASLATQHSLTVAVRKLKQQQQQQLQPQQPDQQLQQQSDVANTLQYPSPTTDSKLKNNSTSKNKTSINPEFVFPSVSKPYLADGSPNSLLCRPWNQILKSVYSNFSSQLTPRAYSLALQATRTFAANHSLNYFIMSNGHSTIAIPQHLFRAFFLYILDQHVFDGYSSDDPGDDDNDDDFDEGGAGQNTDNVDDNSLNGNSDGKNERDHPRTLVSKSGKNNRENTSISGNNAESSTSSSRINSSTTSFSPAPLPKSITTSSHLTQQISPTPRVPAFSPVSKKLKHHQNGNSQQQKYRPWADVIRDRFPSFKTSRQDPTVRQRYNRVNQLAIRFHAIHGLNRASQFGGTFGIPARLEKAWIDYVIGEGVFGSVSESTISASVAAVTSSSPLESNAMAVDENDGNSSVSDSDHDGRNDYPDDHAYDDEDDNEGPGNDHENTRDSLGGIVNDHSSISSGGSSHIPKQISFKQDDSLEQMSEGLVPKGELRQSINRVAILEAQMAVLRRENEQLRTALHRMHSDKISANNSESDVDKGNWMDERILTRRTSLQNEVNSAIAAELSDNIQPFLANGSPNIESCVPWNALVLSLFPSFRFELNPAQSRWYTICLATTMDFHDRHSIDYAKVISPKSNHESLAIPARLKDEYLTLIKDCSKPFAKESSSAVAVKRSFSGNKTFIKHPPRDEFGNLIFKDPINPRYIDNTPNNESARLWLEIVRLHFPMFSVKVSGSVTYFRARDATLKFCEINKVRKKLMHPSGRISLAIPRELFDKYLEYVIPIINQTAAIPTATTAKKIKPNPAVNTEISNGNILDTRRKDDITGRSAQTGTLLYRVVPKRNSDGSFIFSDDIDPFMADGSRNKTNARIWFAIVRLRFPDFSSRNTVAYSRVYNATLRFCDRHKIINKIVGINGISMGIPEDLIGEYLDYATDVIEAIESEQDWDAADFEPKSERDRTVIKIEQQQELKLDEKNKKEQRLQRLQKKRREQEKQRQPPQKFTEYVTEDGLKFKEPPPAFLADGTHNQTNARMWMSVIQSKYKNFVKPRDSKFYRSLLVASTKFCQMNGITEKISHSSNGAESCAIPESQMINYLTYIAKYFERAKNRKSIFEWNTDGNIADGEVDIYGGNDGGENRKKSEYLNDTNSVIPVQENVVEDGTITFLGTTVYERYFVFV